MGNEHFHVLKRVGLLLLIAICLTARVIQADDDYYYSDLYDDESLGLYYGAHLQDESQVAPPTEPHKHETSPVASPEPPTSEKTSSSSEKNQENSNKGKEISGQAPGLAVTEQSHSTSEQSIVVSEQSLVVTEKSHEVSEPAEGSSVQSQEDSAIEPDLELHQLAAQNTNALRQITEIMTTVVSKLSTQGCKGTDGSQQNLGLLSQSITEGFTVLVRAVQELNTTLQHYQQEIATKAFGVRGGTARVFERDGPCPSPFYLVGSDCLYIETDHLRNFNSARQACIEMGAKLAELTTYEPFIAAVRAMDLHRDAEVLIGATDHDDESNWVWVSGGPIPPVIWGPGEPNNINSGEHCIALRAEWGQFNDLQCINRREYACQWTTNA